jgi:hypothetical protein
MAMPKNKQAAPIYVEGLQAGCLLELYTFRLMKIDCETGIMWRLSVEASALNDLGFLQKFADDAAAGRTADECIEGLGVRFDDDKQGGLF